MNNNLLEKFKEYLIKLKVSIENILNDNIKLINFLKEKNEQNNNEIKKHKEEIEFLKNDIIKYKNEILDAIKNGNNKEKNLNYNKNEINIISISETKENELEKNKNFEQNSETETKYIENEKLKKIKKMGKDYLLNNLEFINITCKKCKQKKIHLIFKCVICDNYWLCETCHKSNIINKFHEHIDFFHIIYPHNIINQIKKVDQEIQQFNYVINTFYNLLKESFFDKDGNIIIKDVNIGVKTTLSQICDVMISVKADPMQYFLEYKNIYINNETKKMDQKAKEIIFNKINFFFNNILDNINSKK